MSEILIAIGICVVGVIVILTCIYLFFLGIITAISGIVAGTILEILKGFFLIAISIGVPMGFMIGAENA